MQAQAQEKGTLFFFLGLCVHRYVVCVNWDNASTREMEVFFVSRAGQTNKCIQSHSDCYPRWQWKLRKHRACICPCAHVYLTHVNILVLMLGLYMYVNQPYVSNHI